MADYRAPLEEMRFQLYDVLQMDQLWSQLPAMAEVNRELVDAVLEEGAKIAENLLAPLNRDGDEQGCQFDNGAVTTPAGFREAYKTFAAGGWVGLGGDPAYGGQGMPKAVGTLIEEMLFAGNCSFTLYPLLSAGAALAILNHGSDELKSAYLPKLYSGEWAGVMDLTEPHAGSDLGLIKTRAEPRDDGSYSIVGTKIFITGGEQDLTDNIIHMVLAKLPDAPPGSRGISLFLVPKFLPDAEGNPGARNALSCGSIEHKMGIKASSTAVMNFDGATGYLVGEPHQGLACMFTMMNYERLSMGQQGLGLAEMAYQQAAAYARERLQGRGAGATASAEQAEPIIEHPDVRRMLLVMRSGNEAGRSFALYVARQLDIARYHPDAAAAERAAQLVALLTPVAKAFMTDRGFEACVLGQQVFGGHGYIREWGLEQLVRDARIAQIYEGTNGIQCLDLVGRKVLRDKGRALAVFLEEVQQDLQRADGDLAGPVRHAVSALQSISSWLLREQNRDPQLAGSVAADYMELLGLVCYGWSWVRIASAAAGRAGDFYASKAYLARFYLDYLLPRSEYLAQRMRRTSGAVNALPAALF